MKTVYSPAQTKSQPETSTAEAGPVPLEKSEGHVQDPIIDILRDEFEFEDDYLVLFSASKCGPGPCPDC